MHLLIYTPIITPRVQYAWEVLLHYALHTEFLLTSDHTVYKSAQVAKINYSNQRLLTKEVFIPQGNLLLEADIRPQSLSVFQHEGLPAFFQQNTPDTDFPFDLPALAFYLVSRYEEYLPFESDAHGRFEAPQSLAFQHHFLQQPLVNEWALRLCELLQHLFPQLNITKPDYHFTPTYDLDLAWAYCHRGWLRTLGGYGRDLFRGDFKTLRRRWRVQQGQEQDPFFTYNFLQNLHEKHQIEPYLFILLGNYAIYDKNIHYKNKYFQKLIQHLALHYQVGIHPSYASNENTTRLREEVRRLFNIIGEPVVRSRQHFLKLKFPQTYQNLLALNIYADYSLGYASAIGFRASIAQAYPWYDLSQETKTPLLLHPFQVMDVTLKDYLKLSPQEAKAAVSFMLEKIRAVGGTFSPLWHNSSLSDVEGWTAWRRLYEEIVEMAIEMA
ncbi:MAG: polysaccharide deacetylase family protein [Saprospiraceae bacterium]